ncbi:hypothetical protein VN97_g3258 [Penicillium thymicola]|uniref:Uncharacterized protein n=1 Tax=Penicillium thymicola TaxID=293382 RepID=A0AAI9TMH5_PENTH|nr:hypothetical protein VN97_g3258 [Penicillium thymicola]
MYLNINISPYSLYCCFFCPLLLYYLIPSFSLFSISSNFAAACLTHKIHHALLYSLRWQRRAVCQRQHHPLRPS